MNPCDGCALCCMETEMTLSKKDIDLILNSLKSNNKKEDFVELNPNGLSQLKNIEGHCFFLDVKKKMCNIYGIRPQGCRFYPIVYDIENSKCIYDKDCPRINLFRLSNRDFKKICNHIRLFLKNNLDLPI